MTFQALLQIGFALFCLVTFIGIVAWQIDRFSVQRTGKDFFPYVARTAFVLTCIVVVLGAFVRLSDAGLGCPDWPGCYGQIGVPETPAEIDAANKAFPERPVESAKGWKEMVHRYVAGLLGVLILALTVMAWLRPTANRPRGLTTTLLVLVIFQAALGMWTVTLLLKPFIVSSHLFGGLATLSLLWWLVLRSGGYFNEFSGVAWRRSAVVGLLIVIAQIGLGAWTSTNYAALACPDFPTCQQQWWPAMDFRLGFELWHELGVDYEGGILPMDARTAIHVVHRIGALITTLYCLWLGWRLLRSGVRALRQLGFALLAALLFQVSIAITMVLTSMPLLLATAHNAGAAALLLVMVTLNYAVRRPSY